MSKIKITNLTEGFLIVNSIQINNNKLAIPPKADAVIDAEYQDDSHIQELMRMKKIKVVDFTPVALPKEGISSKVVKKSHHKAKPAKETLEDIDQALADQEGSSVTFMTEKGSPKKGNMVNSILDKEAKKGSSKNANKGPLIDEPKDGDDDEDKPSEAFVSL